jgi:hypothetical protein
MLSRRRWDGIDLAPGQRPAGAEGGGRAMFSVQCRIKRSDKPEIWIEIEIGVDNDDKPFWKLTRKSSVSFNAFFATKGTWEYTRLTIVDKDGNGEESGGLDVNGDGLDGFALAHVPKGFYRMNCGQVRTGKGFRINDGVDVGYKMEFLCV